MSDLLGLLPVSLLRSTAGAAGSHSLRRGNGGDENGADGRKKRHHNRSTATASAQDSFGEGRYFPPGDLRLSPLVQSFEDPALGPDRRHVSVQTEEQYTAEEEESFNESPEEENNSSPPRGFQLMYPQHSQNGGGGGVGGDNQQKRRGRPVLVKQKHSVCSDDEEETCGKKGEGAEEKKEREGGDGLGETNGMSLKIPSPQKSQGGGDGDGVEGSSPKKVSPRGAGGGDGEEGSTNSLHLLHPHHVPSGASGKKLMHQKKSIVPPSSMSFWKQTSMNDEMIFS